MMTRVLIVEDEAAIGAMTALALEQAGLEVDEADNATLAREKINDRLPDLILLDGMLPVSADWSLSGACVVKG
ncbi:MAG: response regulator [Proteobacteria bacterium]|nr:MAG: response regulator [Pseudomonadota bacterium]QKK10457.1 MAG: response regulator [Pseudomonadota bacterium]